MTRRLTLWITGGAAAASLGLGTAFAATIPGHATSTTGTSGTSAPAGSPAPGTSGSAGSSASPPASTQQSQQQTQLSQPSTQPAHTTAPPVVISGGS